MSGVDDRIVAMKFDNAVFQDRLGETLKSLEKLRGSLDFTNGVKAMGDLNGAAGNVNVSHISEGIEGVSKKFLALATIGITVLSNIATKALTVGAQMIKSMSLQPLMDGFKEYETNMNSIQTVLANTRADGTNLQQVNAALDQLNKYSDQTIYNFSQMARNIGTFTAAGVNLQSSVNAIKGIANLAAISGSSSEQASTAMYQLSQALAAGKVSLMDWNSVVNAGMGGEVFKKALFETGKAMKTITDVPLGASFEEWEKKGGTFREQMQKGWITADVLSTTLSSFSGDLDANALKALGFSAAAADEMVALGKMGLAAATEVKTATQLMDTIKESISSGWSSTFRIIVGDFEEAKKTFTEINAAVGKMVSNSADARNNMLSGWKFLGGRDVLIQGFKDAIGAVGSVLRTVSEAFREFFPRTTALELAQMTKSFAEFAAALRPAPETLDQLKNAFRGVFAGLSIGWEIVKGIFGLFGDIFSMFSGGGGALLGFASDTGLMVVKLQEFLVEGGKINEFFDKLTGIIQKPIEFIKNAVSVVGDFFGSFGGAKAVTEATDEMANGFDRLGNRIDGIRGFFDAIIEKTQGMRDVLTRIGTAIVDWFKELGSNIAKALSPGDFDAAVDTINVGLLGGIVLLLRKFMNGGFKVDFGGGVFEKITGTLDQLTGTLKTMQANVKAQILMRIAAAVGILAASMLVLSTIDSAGLTRALVAMGVGFGQLVTVMVAMDKFASKTAAFKMAPLAAGLALISTSMLILSAAVKNLAGLDWNELARGLAGVAAMMAIMVTAINVMTADTGGMIRAGLAMMAMGTGMRILALAVQAFADMSWSDMARGLVGVGAGLVIIAGAMQLMPLSLPVTAAGILILSVALNGLALAVLAMGSMDLKTIALGLGGIGAGLLIIAGAMQLMPLSLPITAAGLVILAGALNIMALAVLAMGSMDFGTMAKGIGGLAAVLLILVVAMNAMNSALLGATSMVIISGALVVLAGVLKVLGSMSIGEIAKALGALALTFVILGAAAALLQPLIPALFSLSASMALIGTAAALFGAGAMMIAKAFEVIAKVGKTAMNVLIEMIGLLLNALPRLVQGLFDSLKLVVLDLLNTVPLLAKLLTVILNQLLDTIIKLTPKIGEAIGAILTAGLKLLRAKVPDMLNTGLILLQALLRGLTEHIDEIITAAADLMVSFTTSLAENAPKIVDAAVTVLTAFTSAISERAAEIVAAGLGLLTNLLLGIANNIGKVTQAVATVIITFLAEIVASTARIIEAGTNLLIWLLKGIGDNLVKVTNTIGEVIVRFIGALGENNRKIVEAGVKVLTDMLSGITNNLVKITDAVGLMITRFVGALGENSLKIVNAGTDALVKFIKGISDNIQKIIDAGKDLIIKFIQGISNAAIDLANAAADTLITFLNALADTIEKKAPEINAAGRRVGKAIIEGIVMGIANNAHLVMDKLLDMAGNAWDRVKGFFGINSPSKLFMGLGAGLMEGMALGIDNNADMATNSAVVAAEKIVRDFHDSIKKMPEGLPGVDITPTIRPVLDLTQVKAAARGIDSLLGVNAIVPEVSIDRARQIATTTELANEGSTSEAPVHNEYHYEQVINSPRPLSTGDIYKNTRSLIAVEKEELGI